MPNACNVPGCRGNYKDGPKVSAFKFPGNKELQQKWIHAIHRLDFSVTKDSRDAHNEEENDQTLSLEANFEDLGLEQLPSRSTELNFCYTLKPGIREGYGCYWSVRCTQEYGNRLTEADRVWVTAKKFYDDGIFAGISYLKEPETVNINMYVEDYSDINALTKACHNVLKSACYYSLGYFRVTTKLGNGKLSSKAKYVFTAEGELYEEDNYVRKFIMQMEK